MPTSALRETGRGFRDLASLLRPAAGLVQNHSIEPPSAATVGMWRVTIRLQCGHNGSAGAPAPQPCVTGAAAPTRSEAMLRAIGESVERIALHGAPGVLATAAELGEAAFTGVGEDLSLSSLAPAAPTRWYPARHLRTGRDVLVPSGLVDYPGPRDDPAFDPGPSGAASGFGADEALRSALLETVERDAVLVSWARQLQLRAIVLDGADEAGGDDSWRDAEQLLGLGVSAGLSPVVAEVPTSVPGVHCVVGGFRADTPVGPAICVGAKAADRLATAVRGALSESLQLLQHLAATRVARADGVPPTVITGDEDRLSFIASGRGVDALEHWFADPAPPAVSAAGGLTCDDLLGRTMADGLDPVVLDLTERLPRAARDMGWSVVKVVPAGYQPLRVDERCAFGWHLGRLRSAPRRTGAQARRDTEQRGWAPHPLP